MSTNQSIPLLTRRFKACSHLKFTFIPMLRASLFFFFPKGNTNFMLGLALKQEPSPSCITMWFFLRVGSCWAITCLSLSPGLRGRAAGSGVSWPTRRCLAPALRQEPTSTFKPNPGCWPVTSPCWSPKAMRCILETCRVSQLCFKPRFLFPIQTIIWSCQNQFAWFATSYPEHLPQNLQTSNVLTEPWMVHLQK